ncbi:cofactor assembly of complex C subunit B [Pseudanabaena sp. FACHB-1998]|uniref:cofactor assembly of complex C subunit B n=1 Tax=Pseudanabaena sp. FACHB-1998 TaxID=2692858 RepID=UPI0016808F28|nr:cofactor assembly of complex C subunit B [Pseudanabaena sp. FACHB-1998]MBD2177674.1 cofactor assembly of complex C subunit B [Pseudanabaena sp. FACHB-1998]
MPVTVPTIYSTLFLTILLFFGLISFLRGSIKDRTIDACFAVGNFTDDRLLMQVRDHFLQRAYKVIELDPERDVAILLGQVKPSIFLAIFLTFLAAIGLICLGLVLGILIPDLDNIWLWLTFMSPLAGVFYWRGIAREQKVSLQLLPDAKLKVRAHKDEITELQRSLNLEKLEI